MIWLVLCFLATTREWHLEGPVFTNLGAWPQSTVALDTRAEAVVLAGLDHYFWYLDLEDGTLLTERAIPTSPKNLQLVGDRLVVSTSVAGSEPMITVYDTRDLAPLETFFKPTDPLRLGTNFPALWVVERDGVYAVLSQLSPRVFFATQDRIQQERDSSDRLPNSFPYRALELGDRYTLPRTVSLFSHTSGLKNKDEGLIEYYHNWFASSRMLYFGALGDNYVVCYEIPDLIDGIHVGNHLGIQMLDSILRPLGPVRERFGQVAGVADNKLHIIYPDGPEPLPGAPGAIEEHYGIGTIESQAQLLDLFDRYRKLENGSHRITVETFVPDTVSVVE